MVVRLKKSGTRWHFNFVTSKSAMFGVMDPGFGGFVFVS